MPAAKHVIFVCTGNTCRSPMAEGLFRRAIESRPDYQVASAGVSARAGSPIARETASILKKHGIDMKGFASQPVTDKLLSSASHVFAMTRSHLRMLETVFPAHSDKFFLTCEFADIPGAGIGIDIPDPIGMGREAYEEVAGILNAAIPSIIAYIDGTTKD